MTIKQQGGVFGRHPTFNTLDVEASASIDGNLSVDGSTLYVDATNNRVGVGTPNPSALFDVVAASAAAVQVRNTGTAASLLASIDSGNNSIYSRGASSSTGRNFYLKQGSTNSVLFDTSHNVHALLGNIVIGTSGKGIDFSATAGTGTSELFDDYEEGLAGGITLTPGTSGSFTMNSALDTLAYTKVGRMVSITGMISCTNASATGTFVELNGLPFAAADLGETSGRFVGMAFFDGSTGSPSVIGFGLEGWTKVRFVIDASTVTGNLFVNINYIAA